VISLRPARFLNGLSRVFLSHTFGTVRWISIENENTLVEHPFGGRAFARPFRGVTLAPGATRRSVRRRYCLSGRAFRAGYNGYVHRTFWKFIAAAYRRTPSSDRGRRVRKIKKTPLPRYSGRFIVRRKGLTRAGR